MPIYDQEADIFSPNALGATINDETLPRLKVEIIAGRPTTSSPRTVTAICWRSEGSSTLPTTSSTAAG